MTLITRIIGFVILLALPNILGYACGYHVRKFADEYYPSIKKPFWGPPRFLFKPIWAIMFTINGISSYLVWRQYILTGIPVKIPLTLYGLQLFFAVNWPPLFFRIQSPLIALLDLGITFGLASLTNLTFAVISPKAAQLFFIYTVWLAIIGYFNKCVWRLNQGSSKSKVSSAKKSKSTKSKLIKVS